MINLEKGQRVSLGLSNLTVGLGWEPSTQPGVEFDLDASAWMIGENQKLPADNFLVFYNNLESPDGAIKSSGDDRTGGNSKTDDETLTIDLTKVDSRVNEIVITATIHDAVNRKQNFGQVRNAYIHILDTVKNEEIARYDLDEDFSIETAVEFGRLYRRNGEWKFEAMGIGYKGGMDFFVNKYAN